MGRNFGKVSMAQNVSAYLRKALAESNPHMTQNEFAQQMFVDERTVRRWLVGGVNSLDVVAQIAEFFHADARDILFGDEEDVPFYVFGSFRFQDI